MLIPVPPSRRQFLGKAMPFGCLVGCGCAQLLDMTQEHAASEPPPHKFKDPSIGYSAHCFSDFAGASAFNPKLKLVRTKTLMRGHDCCNHRWTLS